MDQRRVKMDLQMSPRGLRARWLQAVVMLLVIGLFAAVGAGCNGDDSDSADGGDAAEDAGDVAEDAPSGEAPSGEAVELEPRTIGILNVNNADPAATVLQEGAEAAIETLGWSSFAVDAQGDPARMASGMTQIVNRNPDAILLDAVDPATVTAGLRAASEADIPVIVYGGSGSPSPDVAAEIAPSDFTFGSVAAQYLVTRLNGQGNIAILTTDAIPFAGRRTETVQTILEQYPDIEIVATRQVDYANYQTDAVSATRAVLQGNPNLDAILATISPYGGAIATGLQQANAQDDVFIVGFYAYGPYLEQIEQGQIAAAINTPLEQSSYQAVDALAQFFGHDTPISGTAQFQIPAQYTVITADNLSQATEPPVDFVSYYTDRWSEQFANVG